MEDREAILLSALLHDIGKFGQRAGQKLTPADRLIEPDCCPLWKGKYTHTHVLHSGKWVREKLGESYSQVEILCLYHHAPEACQWSGLAKILSLADRLSSGEREPLPEEECTGKVIQTPLTNLFTKLWGKKGKLQDLSMLPLAPDLAPWFVTGPVQTNYITLWEGFNQDVARLDKASSFDFLFHQLISLLEKYTFFMPSAAYRDQPDISLYHHLKTTAALAVCLYDLEASEEDVDNLLMALKPGIVHKAPLDRPDFILLAADISGIQDFIYSITSEHALKGLKGRSLYLELLGQAVARQLLGGIRLPLTNLLFIGGGHFYLLLPNTDRVTTTIEKWQQWANEVLVKAHNGRLALVLHREQLTYRHFLRSKPGAEKYSLPDFADVWRKAGAGLARAKRRKFDTFWARPEITTDILGPFEATGEEAACPVCGEESLSGPGELCLLCQSFAALASRAAAARYLEINCFQPQSLLSHVSSYEEIFQALGVRFRFWDGNAPPQPEQSLILNNTDINTSKGPCRGFAFLAHHVPRRNDATVKTLEDLAYSAGGIKKWALLRADVDDLGKVFTEGLGSEDRTLSRLSTLSSLLSLFFSAHVEVIVKDSRYQNSVYLVYAGGDDLCLLAPWSILPDLACRLCQDFSNWTHGCLTLSAGLYLAPRDKFPVYRAAGGAGDLLAFAKQSGKNALGIFDQAVTWEEMQTLATIKDQLIRLIDQHQVPRSLFTLLMASWSQHRTTLKAKDEGKLSMYQVWRLLYGLRRLIERLSRDQKMAAIKELSDLEKTLVINYELRPHTDIAVRWADFLTRKEE
ncbi:MAG: type III-A CRISPR-associated protein Cas10/Csm1 [Desulfobacteraceae bacterium]